MHWILCVFPILIHIHCNCISLYCSQKLALKVQRFYMLDSNFLPLPLFNHGVGCFRIFFCILQNISYRCPVLCYWFCGDFDPLWISTILTYLQDLALNKFNNFFFFQSSNYFFLRGNTNRLSSRLRCFWKLWSSSIILRNVMHVFFHNKKKKRLNVSLFLSYFMKDLFIWYWYSPKESLYLLYVVSLNLFY